MEVPGKTDSGVFESEGSAYGIPPVPLPPDAAGPLPAVLAEALTSPARPLPGQPEVCLHMDGLAQRAAAVLGAQAVTIGGHVLFGAGRFQPGTAAGDRLLAHELAHVQHQVRNGTPSVDRKPDPAPPDPYQPLADRIADARRSGPILGPDRLVVLNKLDELAKAVEAGDVAAAQRAVGEFIELDTAKPLDPATAVLLHDVPLVLVSRLFLLGLSAESQRLERYFFGTRKSAYDQPTRGGGYSTRYAVFSRVVDEVVAGARYTDPDTAERAIDRALVAFRGINEAAAQLDLAEIRKAQDQTRADAMARAGTLDPLEGLSSDRTLFSDTSGRSAKTTMLRRGGRGSIRYCRTRLVCHAPARSPRFLTESAGVWDISRRR